MKLVSPPACLKELPQRIVSQPRVAELVAVAKLPELASLVPEWVSHDDPTVRLAAMLSPFSKVSPTALAEAVENVPSSAGWSFITLARLVEAGEQDAAQKLAAAILPGEDNYEDDEVDARSFLAACTTWASLDASGFEKWTLTFFRQQEDLSECGSDTHSRTAFVYAAIATLPKISKKLMRALEKADDAEATFALAAHDLTFEHVEAVVHRIGLTAAAFGPPAVPFVVKVMQSEDDIDARVAAWEVLEKLNAEQSARDAFQEEFRSTLYTEAGDHLCKRLFATDDLFARARAYVPRTLTTDKPSVYSELIVRDRDAAETLLLEKLRDGDTQALTVLTRLDSERARAAVANAITARPSGTRTMADVAEALVADASAEALAREMIEERDPLDAIGNVVARGADGVAALFLVAKSEALTRLSPLEVVSALREMAANDAGARNRIADETNSDDPVCCLIARLALAPELGIELAPLPFTHKWLDNLIASATNSTSAKTAAAPAKKKRKSRTDSDEIEIAPDLPRATLLAGRRVRDETLDAARLGRIAKIVASQNPKLEVAAAAWFGNPYDPGEKRADVVVGTVIARVGTDDKRPYASVSTDTTRTALAALADLTSVWTALQAELPSIADGTDGVWLCAEGQLAGAVLVAGGPDREPVAENGDEVMNVGSWRNQSTLVGKRIGISETSAEEVSVNVLVGELWIGAYAG